MTLWLGVLYFGTSRFNSALFAFLFFFSHVIRIFVISDVSSKSPSFHVPAIPRKLCFWSCWKGTIGLWSSTARNVFGVLHFGLMPPSVASCRHCCWPARHLLEFGVETRNSNVPAGLVKPAADDQTGDYVPWALFHVLVNILNILS